MKPGKHQRRSTTLHSLLFCAHTLFRNYVTNTFLLVSSSVSSKQLLCFVHGKGQKSEQKTTTKNFVEFHNHSPLLTIVEGLFLQNCANAAGEYANHFSLNAQLMFYNYLVLITVLKLSIVVLSYVSVNAIIMVFGFRAISAKECDLIECEMQNVSPSHSIPLPLFTYPSAQRQVNDPSVFLHTRCLSSSQFWGCAVHSSISDHET